MADLHQELIDEARKYKLPQPAVELLSHSPPLMLTAITGGGKTTVAARIIQQTDYRHVITHTTRAIRPGEVNGVNYWFVSEVEMLKLIKSGAFIEVQAIHSDTIYGTSINAYQTVLQDGYKPILVIDVQGVQEVIAGIPPLKSFFILPPNYEAWIERLHSRGAMSPSEKAKRLDSARREIEAALVEPHFTLVVNNDIDQTVREILQGTTRANQNHSRQVAQSLIDSIKT